MDYTPEKPDNNFGCEEKDFNEIMRDAERISCIPEETPEGPSQPTNRVRPGIGATFWSWEKPRYYVTLDAIGPDAKAVKKQLQKALGYSLLKAGNLVKEASKANGGKVFEQFKRRWEADEIEVMLEQVGAAVTITEQYTMEAWITSGIENLAEVLTEDPDFRPIHPVLLHLGSCPARTAKLDTFTLLNFALPRVSPVAEEDIANCSQATLEDGTEVPIKLIGSVVDATPKTYVSRSRGVVTNAYAVYCKGMSTVHVALTKEDCIQDRYVPATCDDTPERNLLVPVDGEIIRMENPFRAMMEPGQAAQSAVQQEQPTQPPVRYEQPVQPPVQQEQPAQPANRVRPGDGAALWSWEEPQYYVTLNAVGPDAKAVKKQLQRAFGYNILATLAVGNIMKEASKAKGGTVLEEFMGWQEANGIEAMLEQVGATVTVTEHYTAEVWLSSGIEGLTNALLEDNPGFDYVHSVLLHLGSRPVQTAKLTIDDLLAFALNTGEDTVHGASCTVVLEDRKPVDIKLIGSVVDATPQTYISQSRGVVTNAYAVYSKGMSTAYVALTKGDCLQDRYVPATCDDTPERNLLVPVDGEIIRMENPFRAMMEPGQAAQSAVQQEQPTQPAVRYEQPVQPTVQQEQPASSADLFCRNCGAALRAGDHFCSKCGHPV